MGDGDDDELPALVADFAQEIEVGRLTGGSLRSPCVIPIRYFAHSKLKAPAKPGGQGSSGMLK